MSSGKLLLRGMRPERRRRRACRHHLEYIGRGSSTVRAAGVLSVTVAVRLRRKNKSLPAPPDEALATAHSCGHYPTYDYRVGMPGENITAAS